MSAKTTEGPLSSAEVSVKLFVDDNSVVRPLELITVFQRWITEGVLEDELTIDVANYEHVPQGPGIMLICDKAHYYFDVRQNRWGLRYRGRREARPVAELLPYEPERGIARLPEPSPGDVFLDFEGGDHVQIGLEPIEVMRPFSAESISDRFAGQTDYIIDLLVQHMGRDYV